MGDAGRGSQVPKSKEKSEEGRRRRNWDGNNIEGERRTELRKFCSKGGESGWKVWKQ